MNDLNTDNNQPLVGLVFPYNETDDLISTCLQVDTPEIEVPLSPLSPPEELLRAQCEEDIEEGLAAINNVGYRLHLIKTQKLFRSTHPSFEKYCAEVFGISRVHANRKIDAYQTESLLKSEPIGSVSIPETESQAREMANLSPEQKKKVARKVKAVVGNRRPNAKDFKKARNEVCPGKAASKDKTIPGKQMAPIDTVLNKSAEKVPAQEPTSLPTIADLPISRASNIITPVELFPGSKVLSLSELSTMADTLHKIFLAPARRNEAGTLLFKLKAHLQMYAEWEKKHLGEAPLKEAA